MKLLGSRENAVFLAKIPLPHFLHHFHHHFALTGNDLLDTVIELEEGILAVDDETGRTGLAHQDAALTKREGTIARISSTSCARSTLLSESRHRLAIICYKSIKNPRNGKVANPQKMMGMYFPEKGCHLGTNRSDKET